MLGVYIGTIILLNIPYVQQKMSVYISEQLSAVLGSRISIGNVDMGLLDRIIIDDLLLHDQSGKEMLKVSRLSATLDLFTLLKGKISINNIQLFSFNANLNRATPDAKANFQFVIDAFAPKDTVPKDTDLDIRINSMLIRRGNISYDVHSAPETPGRFNPQHIHLSNLLANISLKALQKDSVNAAIKRMSVEEECSGFELKRLSLKVTGNEKQMHIDNFSINLPNTALEMDTIRMEYDSLGSFARFVDDVRFSFHLLPSDVVLQDLSAFVPAFEPFKEKMRLEMETSGTINQLNCSKLLITGGNNFLLKGDVSLQDLSDPEDAYVFGNLSNLYIDADGVAFFMRNLGEGYQGVPPALQRLGRVSFRGQVSGYFTDLVTYGEVKTDVGDIKTDVKFSSNKEKGYFSYSGAVKTDEFNLGELLDDDKFGKITFNMQVKGTHYEKRYPAISLKGLIAAFDYNDYNYKDITLDGDYNQGGFNGSIALDDENGEIRLNGAINTASHTPTYNFRAEVNHFRPNALRLTPKYKDTEISLRVKADFTGKFLDDMNGEINMDSLQYLSPEQDYFLDNLRITARQNENQEKRLTINSNFLRGVIEGDYAYQTLPASVMSIMQRYIPSLIQSDRQQQETENNFSFDLHIYNTKLLSTVFQIPFRVYAHSTLKGYFNDKMQRLRIEGYFPRFSYGDDFMESGALLCENPGEQFRTRLRFTKREASSAINISLEAKAKNDEIEAVFNWGNNSVETYSGKLAAVTRFVRAQEEEHTTTENIRTGGHKKKKKPLPALKTIVDVQETDIILNDTIWKIHPSQIVVDSGKVYVNDFNFSHEERHLRINGILSDSPQDTVKLNLKEINIGYVFDIADLGVNFKGEATGPAYASGVFSYPVMSTDLFIRNLGLNDGLLGDAHIHGEWHHDVKGIYLDARIREQDIARTHVYGYIYPLVPTSSLDLQIEADNTNLQFIHFYMQSITPEFTGRARGNVHFYGKFKALTMEGRVFGDASMKVDVLNTTFFVKDSIYIHPGGLTFRNNRIFDTKGHQGRMEGYLHYNHFKNLDYRFRFDVNNMLIMNTKESPDFAFYGTVYGTGNATIAGNEANGVNIDVAMTTNRNTTFTYMKESVASAASTQFIHFVDKTPRRVLQDSIILTDYEMARQQANEEKESNADLHLNLLIDATPDASMRIIMDPVTGDYISGKGSGNIRTEFYNKGDVKMFGNYRISQGVYKFSLQEIIRKDFTIKDGSTIMFNGQPKDANLDIQASYLVNSASLNDLIPDASDYVTQTNVKVNCLMNLTGPLTSPDVKMSLELPNERDEVQALVRNYISTDEQMNMQMLYLLSIGKFYPTESTSTTQNSNMMSSVLSSTLSGQLNNALSQIIDNNNWNIGTNFSTGQNGWTDVEFETMLSGQLLNNRLIINGNFGYRENSLANTNFVGDFRAEWLVNRSGDIRLIAYNETNNRYYTKTNLTTQGIGILFKKDFTKWNELLFWNRWKLKRLKKQQNKKVGE